MQVIITPYGCRSPVNSPVKFRCEMCQPRVIQGDVKAIDCARSCAQSKINRGLIEYYYIREYEEDKLYGTKKLISKKLIEHWRDELPSTT